jgi:hypothetical protein
MLKKILLLTFPFFLISCANNPTGNQQMTNGGQSTMQNASATTQIDFYDSEIFDLKLGTGLLSEPATFRVDVLTPFSINQIPRRLDVWLTSVSNHGGSVQTKPDPDFQNSKAFSEILDLIIQVYKEVKEIVIYGAAANYNVTVFYKPNGNVTKVIFTHK